MLAMHRNWLECGGSEQTRVQRGALCELRMQFFLLYYLQCIDGAGFAMPRLNIAPIFLLFISVINGMQNTENEDEKLFIIHFISFSYRNSETNMSV